MKLARSAFPLLLLATALVLAVLPTLAHGEGEAVEGKVVEAIEAGPYTYVRLEVDDGEMWIAGPKTAVAAGQSVRVGDTMTMKDFHSESLDRTFASIEFVAAIDVVGAAGHGTAAPDVAAAHGAARAATPTTVEEVARAEGGSTVAELFARRADLGGKPVVVRGRVVKFSSGIMGRNWIHIQDGTGEPGANDLTVTTDATAAVGDVVTVRGTAAVDKDFGMGYRYDLIVEEADVTVE